MKLSMSKRVAGFLCVVLITVSLFGISFSNKVIASPLKSTFDCLATVPNDVPTASTWSYPPGFSISDVPPRQSVVLDSAVNPGVPHNGEDYGNHSAGDEVRAAADGIVACVFEGTDKGNLGHAVFVLSKLSDGKHITTLYAHLSAEKFVNIGAKVFRGDTMIGKIGNRSENGDWSPHLHVGIRDGYVIGREDGWPLTCWGYLKPTCPLNVADEFKRWHALSDFVAKYPASSSSKPPAPAPSTNRIWRTSTQTIFIDFPWQYTFGFCDDRRIRLFLDNNQVLDTLEDEKHPKFFTTVGMWRGNHAVRFEVLDYPTGTYPELVYQRGWSAPACKGQVLGTSAATKPTIAPVSTVASVPTVALPPTVIASGSSALGTPSLVSPPNGSLISHTTSISLIWKPVVGASSYRVEFLGDQKPTSLSCGVNVNVICSFKDVRPGTLYWHVKAIGANGNESDWSNTWSFTIQESGTTSTTSSTLKGNLSLEGHADRTNIRLTWMWDGGQPDGYKIYLDGQLHTTISNPNTTSYSFTQPCAKFYTFYVTAYNASGESPRSNTSRAYTGDCATSPTLISPEKNSIWPQTAEINLKWNSVTEDTEYLVEWWGPSRDRTIPCDWITETSCKLPMDLPGMFCDPKGDCIVGAMLPGQNFWRVKARTQNGQESDWSEPWAFTIQGAAKNGNDVHSLRVVSDSYNEVVVEIDYFYTGEKDNTGQYIGIGATAIQPDGADAFGGFCFTPIQVHQGNHNATVTMDWCGGGSGTYFTTEIKVCMYVGGQECFYSENFPHEKIWDR